MTASTVIPVPVITGAATLVTLVSGLGIALSLPGGCMLVSLLAGMTLTTFIFLLLVGLPTLYYTICGIPTPAGVKSQAWIAAAMLIGWYAVMMAANTIGLQHCIA